MFNYSCGNSSVSPLVYVNYVDDISNGLIRERKIGPYMLRCELKPAAYIVLKEKFKETKNIDMPLKMDEIKDAGKMYHFYIKLSSEMQNDILKKDIQSEQELYGRIEYFTHAVQSDLFLLTGADTLPCSYYLFERNFGAGAISTMLLGFDSERIDSDSEKQLTLLFDDHVLGIGPVQFAFKTKDIKRTPTMNTINL